MKAGQFETCFIIQTYNRLSRSLSRVVARSYIHVSRKLAYAFYDFLAEGILISVDNVAAVAISVVAATTIRCGNLTIWTVSRWYTKFTIILKPGGGEKRIPQWTFYFFEKAILNGCRVRAYFILLPGILYYLSIEKLENLKFRHSKVWIKYLDWTFFRCDKNISSSETRRRISSNFVHHLKLNRLISRYRVRIIYICLAEYIYIHTR